MSNACSISPSCRKISKTVLQKSHNGAKEKRKRISKGEEKVRGRKDYAPVVVPVQERFPEWFAVTLVKPIGRTGPNGGVSRHISVW